MAQIIKPFGATKKKTIVGRGASSKGRACGRGHDGQNSRTGGGPRLGFEGGQMPIQRRLPKFGFKNPTRVEYRAINLKTIQALVESLGVAELGINDFIAAGIASKGELVKVLAVGEISTAVVVNANAFSKSAAEKIQAAGGKAVVIE